MNKQEAYKEKANAELDKIGAELTRLRAMAAEAKAEQKAKLTGYIDTLEETKEALGGKLESFQDSSGDAMDDIKRGLKDAWDRLAIAKQAAEARFH
jgi:hypothetical protein